MRTTNRTSKRIDGLMKWGWAVALVTGLMAGVATADPHGYERERRASIEPRVGLAGGVAFDVGVLRIAAAFGDLGHRVFVHERHAPVHVVRPVIAVPHRHHVGYGHRTVVVHPPHRAAWRRGFGPGHHYPHARGPEQHDERSADRRDRRR